jgi:hypothetical protein
LIVNALFETYHRISNSATQSATHIAQMLSTGLVCGHGARQSGGSRSPIASAKAFLGPLPSTEQGIEFTTNIQPTSKSPYLGGPCYWHAGGQGVQGKRGDSLACIPVTIVKIV